MKHIFNQLILLILIFTSLSKVRQEEDPINPDELEAVTTNFVLKFKKHFPTLINIINDFVPDKASAHFQLDAKTQDKVDIDIKESITKFNKIYRHVLQPFLQDAVIAHENPGEGFMKLAMSALNAYNYIQSEFPQGVHGEIRPTNADDNLIGNMVKLQDTVTKK